MKIGDTVTPRIQHKRGEGKKDYYLILEVGQQQDDWLLGTIVSNPEFESNSHIAPLDINDFELTPLKRSYLIEREITLFDFFYELPIPAKAIRFHGEDAIINFKEHRGNFISDAFYEFEFREKQLGGYLFMYYSNEIK